MCIIIKTCFVKSPRLPHLWQVENKRKCLWILVIESFSMIFQTIISLYFQIYLHKILLGLVRDLNPGPLAPKARIIPLDQRAKRCLCHCCIVYKPFSFPTKANRVNFRWMMRFCCVYHFYHWTFLDQMSEKTYIRARPGFEPGTSRTRSENHTPRPTSHRSHFLCNVALLGDAEDQNFGLWAVGWC